MIDLICLNSFKKRSFLCSLSPVEQVYYSEITLLTPSELFITIYYGPRSWPFPEHWTRGTDKIMSSSDFVGTLEPGDRFDDPEIPLGIS